MFVQKKRRGRYYRSEKEYMNATGHRVPKSSPCIHISGSVRGMRKQFWGYSCDVVRVGQWIYKVS